MCETCVVSTLVQNVIAAPPDPIRSKLLGAFYTPSAVAEFLVGWAIRSPTDVILDPSSGGGVFLKAAIDEMQSQGGNIGESVFGIELDPAAHSAVLRALSSIGLPPDNLRLGDFFNLATQLREGTDAVVGNPPFIRYQQFSGSARDRAARVLEHAGVRMNDLASSWAPFVIGAATLLRPGGRLAMVVPMELCHAAYALPVLSFLARSFRCVQFLSFEKRLFPDLSQDTLLLLADHKGDCQAEFYWKHLPDGHALGHVLERGRTRIRRTTRLPTDAIATGRHRLVEHFLPKKTRELYSLLKTHQKVKRLGGIADVGIGYVTGANDFFHLSAEDVACLGISQSFLRKAVFRGRALCGLRFTDADWEKAAIEGHAGYLLSIPRHQPLTAPVRRLIENGERSKIHEAYKCRVRSPWYVVPHVNHPDAFLTYMSGVSPTFVANDTAAVAPNTLHVVRMLPLGRVAPHMAAVAWQSSLTALSVEIEGHAMGGGMLKLEPSEAQRVLLALPTETMPDELPRSLDVLARHTTSATIRTTVDRMLLRDQMGLTESECRSLREAAKLLRERRLGRSQLASGKGSRYSRRENG
jgi:adenine-specific DNA-methyltransferase